MHQRFSVSLNRSVRLLFVPAFPKPNFMFFTPELTASAFVLPM